MPTANSPFLPPAFVWTRFGAEAGESIEGILSRKESERKANGGTFLWGIGNSVGRAVSLLVREHLPVAVFSPIVGKPRPEDASPAGVVRWTRAEDWLGFDACLPPHTVVTSRADRAKHYALVCRSEVPLSLAGTEEFCINSLVNLESGKPVGASQTTAVVRLGAAAAGRMYRVALCVSLTEPYLVCLADPVVFTHDHPASLQ